MLTPIYLDMSDITIKGWSKKLKFSKFYVQNIWQIVRRWHHQLTHLQYSYGLVKKCFLKICETSKFHNFLIFQPIFIRFSLFCSENFTLSSEIKLDQLRTSPLISSLCVHWVSKETYHFFRATLIKIQSIIKMNHKWAQIRLYNTPFILKHIKKNKCLIESRNIKIRWNHER